ncbi:hypothetical protein EVAR_90984_1 [Eumeta japonica]|uniref:Uncharacterized protein n=1 Tax=Eumeta variegata TaxID=151549 RepID=A0A4C1Z607_EUMVA|nr:hypothetical protein EVAR_90984_1 [Eumeta japonica]
MRFGVPMQWKEQKNHYDDCYFRCVNLRDVNFKKMVYPDLQNLLEDPYHIRRKYLFQHFVLPVNYHLKKTLSHAVVNLAAARKWAGRPVQYNTHKIQARSNSFRCCISSSSGGPLPLLQPTPFSVRYPISTQKADNALIPLPESRVCPWTMMT